MLHLNHEPTMVPSLSTNNPGSAMQAGHAESTPKTFAGKDSVVRDAVAVHLCRHGKEPHEEGNRNHLVLLLRYDLFSQQPAGNSRRTRKMSSRYCLVAKYYRHSTTLMRAHAELSRYLAALQNRALLHADNAWKM